MRDALICGSRNRISNTLSMQELASMTAKASNQHTDPTFKNPDTRERWDWVHRAISFAEDDSQRELEDRSENDATAAPSPFLE